MRWRLLVIVQRNVDVLLMRKDRSRAEKKAIPLSERLSVRIPDAVALTGINRTKLYALIRSGEVPIIKVGRTTVIPIDGLKQFIASRSR